MRTYLFAAAYLVAALLSIQSASAVDYTVGDLMVAQPQSRATPPGTSVGVGYMTIVNDGAMSDRLLGASTPVAGKVEIHQTVEEDGMMKMIEQENGIEVPAGGEAALAPGGYHLMIMGLDEPLQEGTRVPMTLSFERAGDVDIELEVKPIGAQ